MEMIAQNSLPGEQNESIKDESKAIRFGGSRSPTEVRAAVVIPSRNRRDELRRAVLSIVTQSICPEIIVIDDGSTDGTGEMIRSEFPNVRLIRHERPLGQSESRTEGARVSSCDIVFSMDDDAEFSADTIVEETLAGFNHPRVAVVAIPYIEPHKSSQLRQVAPCRRNVWVTHAFIATSYAVRRDVFLHVGGYRGHLIGQGEESDLSIRLLDSGFVVRLGNGHLIQHHESPNRDNLKIVFYGRRNDILFAWQNVPLPYLPIHCLGSTIKGIMGGGGRHRLCATLRGILAGYATCLRFWNERRPVRREIYKLHRSLRKSGTRLLEEIESLLPPLPNENLMTDAKPQYRETKPIAH